MIYVCPFCLHLHRNLSKGLAFFNNACYQVNLDKKNIQDATDSCLNNGAGILTLRSSEEETFLRGELEKDNLNNLFYWLGGDILLLLKGLLHGF